MATIYNSDLTKELIEGGKFQVSRDIIPSQLAEKVVPVMEVNPKLLRRANVFKQNSRSTTGTTTLYSVPSGKRFFLTNITISYSANAANDGTGVYIQFTTPDGITTNYLSVGKLTLTACDKMIAVTLPFPLEIKSGTNITMGGTFTAGSSSMEASIIGFLDDITTA